MVSILLLLALLGHTFLWLGLLNRLHATGWPHKATGLASLLWLALMTAAPVGFVWCYVAIGTDVRADVHWQQIPPAALVYVTICWIASPVALAWWVLRRVLRRPPPVLRFHRRRPIDLACNGAKPASQQHAQHYLVRLPGNEILKLDLTERAIEVPRLSTVFDGLSIVHVSDFHFTGRVGKGYFEEVVRRSNGLEPDLVAVTGDLLDHPDCIDWIPDTLGRLRGRYGVYFILGNHDLRVDTRRLRRVLREAGLVDLGGRWIEAEIRGQPVVLAGNELPWIPPAADMTHCPQRSGGGPPRIVLSHSPDQLDWARAHDADLLLAGHTHGGQIRFPLIGPILTPSRLGVRYASGLFYAPPTVMHVTRGVSGEFPVRINCPPEMAHLVLHSS